MPGTFQCKCIGTIRWIGGHLLSPTKGPPACTSLSQNLLRTIKGKLTAPWNYFEPKFAIYSQIFFSLFHTPLWALAKYVSIFIYFQKSGPTTSSICIRINVWFSSIGSGLREILLLLGQLTLNFVIKNINSTYTWCRKTSMKWISYQISTSYNKLYLINSRISGREREHRELNYYIVGVLIRAKNAHACSLKNFTYECHTL